MKKTLLLTLTTLALAALAGGGTSGNTPTPAGGGNGPTDPATESHPRPAPVVDASGLSWCRNTPLARSGAKWQGNLLRETYTLRCKFPSSSEASYAERSQKYLTALIESLRSEPMKQILDDGREVPYGGADSRFANKFMQGPVEERNWDYADFFKLGLIAKEASGRVVFEGNSPVILGLASGAEDHLYFWQAGGGVRYRIDSRSFNEDDEELKIRNVYYLNGGKDFFIQSSFSEGIALDGSPHEYLKNVVSRYWTMPLETNSRAHVVDLKTTVTAHYTGDAERHISRSEFEERVLVPFGRTVERRVEKLVPSLIEHF